MYRGNAVTLAFPPFSGAVKFLVFANAAIFFLLVLFDLISPGVRLLAFSYFGLLPVAVTHGFLWQMVSYSFLHAGLFHLLFNMLMLWMFGSQIEDLFRRRRFLEFYFFCVFGAALVTVLFSYLGVLGMSPNVPTVGASGGVFGILMAFALIYGDRQIFMFPLPFMIRAKYMVGILAFVQVIGALSATGNVAYLAHLGGLFFGWVYVKFAPRGSLTQGFSLLLAEWRAAWARRKRRRAARKFEVYMRKHNRTVHFDEQGNYIGPDTPPDDRPGDRGRPPGDRPPWVN
jgi:membrane associated rhomboid family serine protease